MTSVKLAPGATIGIIGGGQLGKMMAQSALRMGYRVAVLDPSEDAPAKATSHHFINAAFGDLEALKSLCGMSDVITYEFENIDAEILHTLVDDYYVPQGAKTVLTLQNRETEKQAIKDSGARIVPYEKVETPDAIRAFMETHGAPVIVKTATGGYDGKGQYLIESGADLDSAGIPFDETEFVVEKYITLEREVSLTIARSVSGQVIYFPLQENLHKDQILYRTIVPSRVDYAEQAQKEAERIMKALHFTGAFTIEFFVAEDGTLYVNEIAPRPHNSGHYSIEACNISQFDAHVLSILDHPMPEVYLHQDAVMMNLLGADLDRLDGELFTHPEWNVHVYGKTDRKPARKMGHVTVLTDDLEQTIDALDRDFLKETV
ncbi:5-(carboxyamino)imidazole ribonucleotide synthase [Salinicoccus halodurans]|uniref:N5-carboxyaminoimidazole ribonucleotide synthase n=1 Tax=Salinicoccus halodurans TaxID=407035 RepID=A0A0F7HJP2_9STAP|nr:5-(carboxyamino)imidazole ribonucleotide synthase [Salinicoccus halodurans]AKG73628.1 phosphoribosylaminoimidazole carboxylase [Salinicoccus halodurans]SFK53585.1 5-(carboxyamino)imidazole ribonucleotide synthase [Salinicoccus halodurans]